MFIHRLISSHTGASPSRKAEFKGPSIREPCGPTDEAGSQPKSLSSYRIPAPSPVHPDFLPLSPSGSPLGGQTQLPPLAWRLCGNHPAQPGQELSRHTSCFRRAIFRSLFLTCLKFTLTSLPNWKGPLPGIVCLPLHPVDSTELRWMIKHSWLGPRVSIRSLQGPGEVALEPSPRPGLVWARSPFSLSYPTCVDPSGTQALRRTMDPIPESQTE